jgi:hypothetical protein
METSFNAFDYLEFVSPSKKLVVLLKVISDSSEGNQTNIFVFMGCLVLERLPFYRSI